MSDLIEQLIERLEAESDRTRTINIIMSKLLGRAAACIRELKAEKETLHAQLHGMQDGSLVRDQAARISELEEKLASLPKGFREWNDQVNAIEAATIERCAKTILALNTYDNRWIHVLSVAAEAIRALKTSTTPTQSEDPSTRP